MNKGNKDLRTWLVIVAVVAMLTRAGLWLTYPVASGNDTATYRHLALSLRNNNGFERYNGTRTPGYPIFLMLAGSDQQAYLLQLSMGFLTTLLVFYTAWRLSQRAWFAGSLALAHTLNMGQLFFEAALLSEAVATFLLFTLLAGLVHLLRSPNRPSRVILLIVGLAAAALALTRPLFAFMPFWGAFFMVFFWRAGSYRARLGAAVLTTLPALAVLLVWVNFIHTNFNMLGMDSIGGYHLVNHTSSFFELTPDEYAPVRDTFLRFRTERLATTGSPVNTIWDAIPELMRQTKLNYYALGRLMGEISTRLIREHPWLYAKNLALGWWWFWRVGVFWLPGTFSVPGLNAITPAVMLAERIALFGANLGFIGGSLALLWPKIRRILKMDLFLWFAVSAVWITSILQTLAEHGDNPRFLAPLQTLVVIVVAYWLIMLPGVKRLFSAKEPASLPD